MESFQQNKIVLIRSHSIKAKNSNENLFLNSDEILVRTLMELLLGFQRNSCQDSDRILVRIPS